MSTITYQYYMQGSSQLVVFAATGATSSVGFNTSAVNHISVISSVNASVLVTKSGSLIASATGGATMGQYVPANTEVIIPCVRAAGCSIWGYAAGSAWITEFWAA